MAKPKETNNPFKLKNTRKKGKAVKRKQKRKK